MKRRAAKDIFAARPSEADEDVLAAAPERAGEFDRPGTEPLAVHPIGQRTQINSGYRQHNLLSSPQRLDLFKSFG